MSERILLVDDEPSLVATLRYALGKAGFRVETAADGPAALAAVHREEPDLILLDVMLPRIDGFEVCRTVRLESAVPIVMLTARDDPTDRVVGLEVGADDYVVKPFSIREIVARVRAHLRRESMRREAAPDRDADAGQRDDLLTVGGLVVEAGRWRATLDGQRLPLKRREFSLLAYLARNAGIVMSRSRLLSNVWDGEVEGETRTVDVHVRRLRRHLERDRAHPEYLHTVRGVGYVLRHQPGEAGSRRR
jgi:DNA-binding response OmpR family regulator